MQLTHPENHDKSILCKFLQVFILNLTILNTGYAKYDKFFWQPDRYDLSRY